MILSPKWFTGALCGVLSPLWNVLRDLGLLVSYSFWDFKTPHGIRCATKDFKPPWEYGRAFGDFEPPVNMLRDL